MANPTQARMTAKALAVMMSKASFPRIERSLKIMLLLSPVVSHHMLRQAQQARSDFEPGRFCCLHIDLEANFVLFQQKADHPALIQKAGCLAHRQNRSIAQTRHQLRNAFALRPADKKDLASLQILCLPKVTNAHHPIPDYFAGHRTFQHSLKRVFSERTEKKRIICICRCVRWPIHELGKMEDKRCLNPVFLPRRLRSASLPTSY